MKEVKTKTKKEELKKVAKTLRKKRVTIAREPFMAEQKKTKEEVKKMVKKEAVKPETKKTVKAIKKETGKEVKKVVGKKAVGAKKAKGVTAQKNKTSSTKKSTGGKKSEIEKRVEIREGVVYEEVRTGIEELDRRDKERSAENEEVEIKDDLTDIAGEKVDDDLADMAGEEEKTFIKWTGKNFVRPEGQTFFYEVSLVASVITFLWSAIGQNWLTALTFLALVVMIVIELKDVPRDVEYEINIDGILIDGKLYRFDNIHSFELTKNGDFDIVKLQLHDSIFPTRELHLTEGQDVVYIETLLAYFLPKEKQEDALFNFRKRGKSEEDMTEDEFIDQKVDEYLNGKN
ncbi:MAG: hypothetical protein WC180_02545 [Candidatus Paceibacterota bacterium]|jgi:hypothetical protein